MGGRNGGRHQEKNVGYIFRPNFRRNFRQISTKIPQNFRRISADYTLIITISQKVNIFAKKISRTHDIDISSLNDILLIFNISNIDIDIDIYFTSYPWGGFAPHM